MTKEAVRQLALQFDDNTLAPLLYGECDAHLNRIEEKLGVEIASRGNQLVLTGTKEELITTQNVLESLWDRIIHDLPVGPDEVDAAIRIADSSLESATRKLAKAAFLDPHIEVKGKNLNNGKTKHQPISARSPMQAEYLEAMKHNELVFGLGPAGTGKTYLAVAQAVSMLQSGHVDRLILCRPAVEAGERLGFLPGSMEEKVDPYLRPIYDALNDMMPPGQVIKGLAERRIEVAPLAFMRGRTLSNAFIILDEAQNTTPVQMKMALTRIGENSRMVVTGDPSQTDLEKGEISGLHDAIVTLRDIEGIKFIEFNEADVVRHHLVSKIVHAYKKRDKRER